MIALSGHYSTAQEMEGSSELEIRVESVLDATCRGYEGVNFVRSRRKCTRAAVEKNVNGRIIRTFFRR